MMEEVKNMLKELTGKKYVYLKARGNYAIRDALQQVKGEKILVQDQGGWLRYLDYPPKYGLFVEKLRTNHGIIELEDLKEKNSKADAILYEDPAGYIAEQPVEEIYKLCRKNRCKVILDITGSIGYSKFVGTSDIIITSFGKEKPVNMGYGGLVAADEPLELTEDFDLNYSQKLLSHLKQLHNNQHFLHEKAKEVKEELKNHKVIHRNHDGINVAVAFDTDAQRDELISYCEKKSIPYTICPRYIRVLRDAVCIEIKKLLS